MSQNLRKLFPWVAVIGLATAIVNGLTERSKARREKKEKEAEKEAK